MIKKTIILPNKKLRMISKEVKLPLSKDDEEIAKNLIYYLNYAKKKENNLRSGVGIAAVQLGFLKKMFLVEIDNLEDKEYELLINPKIESFSNGEIALKTGEGCLSVEENIPYQKGHIYRKNKIIISGYSYFQKKMITLTKAGFLAIVYQHEMDHLNGKLFIDRVNKKDPWYKKENGMII